MDRRTAKLLALSALIDEADDLATNGDILPDPEARREMARLSEGLMRRIDRMDGWKVLKQIFESRL